jgi:hypothetical protein
LLTLDREANRRLVTQSGPSVEKLIEMIKAEVTQIVVGCEGPIIEHFLPQHLRQVLAS